MKVRRAVLNRFAALWQRCHPGAGARAPDAVFAEIVDHYGEPHRHYHTIAHVDDCLERFDRIHSLAQDPGAIELALWFHDVIFDSRSRDNERRSAAYYADRAAGATPSFQRHVRSMILASNHADANCIHDLCYVLDIDIAGFGHPWAQFRSTTDLVRAEYPHQSDAVFAESMAKFLGGLASRPWIFATDYFRDACEATARSNIAALLDEWTRAGYLGKL